MEIFSLTVAKCSVEPRRRRIVIRQTPSDNATAKAPTSSDALLYPEHYLEGVCDAQLLVLDVALFSLIA